jgi:ATP-dependent Lhr-like helicase
MERYGVVSREAAASEGIPGGFTPLYQTFKALEESGRVRRGYFVEGLSGAQFAGSATVDRLRNDPDGSLVKEPVLLSTPDPANPYGALLPWPRCGGRPRRASGTTVVLVDGHPVLYLEKGAKKLLSFPKSDEPEFLQAALQGLHRLAKSRRGKMLQVLEIDGQPAQKSAIYPALKAFGFRDDYQGITFLAEP